MEISLTNYCIILCVITFPYLEAKPFSLNQAIAENLKRKHFETLPDISTDLEAKPFSLNQAIAENLKRKHFETLPDISTDNSEDNLSSENTLGSVLAAKKLIDFRTLLNKANIKLPVLNYNKKLQFKKPNKLSVKSKLFQKQGIKREVDENYGINRKYLPVLRSISMLFDDILSPDYKSGESESYVTSNSKFQCKCSRKSTDLQSSQSRAQKKATVTPEAFATEVTAPIETIATTEKVYHITPSSIRSFRQNKILPVLFPRNTTSHRGNNNGFRKRGSPARFRNVERNISRNRGDSKHDSRKRKHQAVSANDKENPNSYPRDYTGFKLGRGISGNRTRTRVRDPTTTEVTEFAKSESIETTRGPLLQLERENSIEIRGDKTESPVYAGGDETEGPIYVPGPSRKSRGFTTKNKEDNIKKSLLSKNDNEKSVNNVTLDNASVEPKPVRPSVFAEKDKVISSTDEPARLTKELLIPYSVTEPSPRNKSAIVMIIDGYSIARDKNGRNRSIKKTNDGI